MFEKDAAREKKRKQKGAMFFYEVEGHIQKLSSFAQVKKYTLKSHLVGNAGAPPVSEVDKFQGHPTRNNRIKA